MKVHLIKQQTIQNFIDRHAPARRSFEAWITTIKYADWNTPEEIKGTYRSADLLGQGSNRVVFNIGGNNYRLIAKYFFGKVNALIFLLNGLVHIQSMMSFVTMVGNIQLMIFNV